VDEKPDIEALFADGREIDAAIAKAVREAILEHKRAGNPIAVWQNGRVVWIPPDEIAVDEPDDNDS
jgi:isoaspartyl peptidase/L-asparaginase-like protein (Ntn-hydrolase superfamily)